MWSLSNLHQADKGWRHLVSLLYVRIHPVGRTLRRACDRKWRQRVGAWLRAAIMDPSRWRICAGPVISAGPLSCLPSLLCAPHEFWPIAKYYGFIYFRTKYSPFHQKTFIHTIIIVCIKFCNKLIEKRYLIIDDLTRIIELQSIFPT